ncbi:MAG: hypothetical protein LBN05_08340 [Oscillospiraceae bacterium]|jgi:hypothetical protein|nr:hypothetical protein [Oscillospiraceae bacterium]
MKNTPRRDLAFYERQLKNGRSNLLMMIVFSAVNVVMLIAQADMSFLFSATLPDVFYVLGDGVDALYPTTVGIALCVVYLAIYLLLWVLSKIKPGALIAALVLFSIDSLVMVYLLVLTLRDGAFEGSFFIEALFHFLVLWSLFKGALAAGKLGSLPDNLPVVAEVPFVPFAPYGQPPAQPYPADNAAPQYPANPAPDAPTLQSLQQPDAAPAPAPLDMPPPFVAPPIPYSNTEPPQTPQNP